MKRLESRSIYMLRVYMYCVFRRFCVPWFPSILKNWFIEKLPKFDIFNISELCEFFEKNAL